jgi:hypothetical protein
MALLFFLLPVLSFLVFQNSAGFAMATKLANPTKEVKTKTPLLSVFVFPLFTTQSRILKH